MSFQGPIQQVIVTDLANGAVVLLDRQPMEAEGGWDSMRDTYLVRWDVAEMDPHDAMDLVGARGDQIAGKTMWIVTRGGRCRAYGLFEIEVVSLGLLSERGLKVRYDAGANSTTAQNISVPGHGIQPNLEAQESQATCDIEYVVVDGPMPGDEDFYTAAVGGAQEPPDGWVPAVKDSIWASLAEFTYHYPNGWVLMASSVENLPGLDHVWMVRDRYQFIYEISP